MLKIKPKPINTFKEMQGCNHVQLVLVIKNVNYTNPITTKIEGLRERTE